MSEQKVEAVRRAIELFNRDGPEAAAAFLDPEIEWHDLPEQPDAGVHHGRDGFLEAVEQFAGGFEDFRVLIDEIFDHGNQVITYNRTVGRGTGSGATFEQRGACVWTLRKGSIVRVDGSERNERPSKLSAWRSSPCPPTSTSCGQSIRIGNAATSARPTRRTPRSSSCLPESWTRRAG